MFSLLVPQKNEGIYSWGELVIGIVLIGLLAFAIPLLPKYRITFYYKQTFLSWLDVVHF